MYGQDVTPNTYALMPTIADHLHWAGGHWTESRGGKGAHSDAGGGHAHSGAMVYLGDNFPEKYRNGLFTCNIHGSRLNHDRLERSGSSYVARHEKDFLFANDPWFRGIAVKYGPDGGVYVTDWNDTGECHNYVEVDRTNGRIYKVTHGSPKHTKIDLAKRSDADLVKLQLHKNDWHVRHARRLLQERAAAGKLDKDTHDGLRAILNDNPDVTRKLRAVWALWATGGLDEKGLIGLMGHDSEYLRAWAVRLAAEAGNPSDQVAGTLSRLAVEDPAPFVRLHLASVLPRLTPALRRRLADKLIQRDEDAGDKYIPLMLWYGVEGLVSADAARSMALLQNARLPGTRRLIARRYAELPKAASDPLGAVLTFAAEERAQDAADILRGVSDALAGRRSMPAPAGWDAASARFSASESAEVRRLATNLAVIFGDAKALARLRDTVRDGKKPAAERISALQTLLTAQKPEEAALLRDLLADKELRGAAVRGLAAYADNQTPALVLKEYPALTDAEKADAVATLASRPAWALALIDAVEKGTVARKDVSAFTLRQLAGSKDKSVAARVAAVFGSVRPASKDRAELTAKWKKELSSEVLAKADLGRGRALFAKNCAACHRLFDDGGNVGPELTGSQRANLDYVLENVLDPSAIVPREYQVTVLELNTGRVLNGIVKEETEKAVVVQTQNERVTVPKDEVDNRSLSAVSMMPEGLLAALSKEEVRDLVAYLASPTQVPLPK
jgi:putative heme-binding domain-containing protein